MTSWFNIKPGFGIGMYYALQGQFGDNIIKE